MRDEGGRIEDQYANLTFREFPKGQNKHQDILFRASSLTFSLKVSGRTTWTSLPKLMVQRERMYLSSPDTPILLAQRSRYRLSRVFPERSKTDRASSKSLGLPTLSF